MPFGPFAGPNLPIGVDPPPKGERHCEVFAAGAAVSTGAFAVMLPSTTATTSPTLAVAPGPTRISDRRPATIACTSIVTLSVSTSNRSSPSLISSPTDLNQARILPSATVSPSCGMMIVEAIGLSVEHAPDLVDDPGRARYCKVFEMICGRQWDVRRGDADDRPIEIPEGFVGDNRCDLRAPATEAGVLFYREEPTGLRDRVEDRLSIERDQRPKIDDLCIDAVLVR